MHDPSTNNIKALLIKVAEGDESAFGQLFRMYYNQLGEFILRITRSEPLTKEIVQDVFLKIWINRRSLTELDTFKAYLLVVARNHAFNCLKQIAREKSRKREWSNTMLYQASNNFEDTTAIDTGSLIDEVVELLPPQQKKVYQLSRRDGMRQKEIARELNISLETVKKHMVLALRFLKKHLLTHTSLFILFLIDSFRR